MGGRHAREQGTASLKRAAMDCVWQQRGQARETAPPHRGEEGPAAMAATRQCCDEEVGQKSGAFARHMERGQWLARVNSGYYVCRWVPAGTVHDAGVARGYSGGTYTEHSSRASLAARSRRPGERQRPSELGTSAGRGHGQWLAGRPCRATASCPRTWRRGRSAGGAACAATLDLLVAGPRCFGSLGEAWSARHVSMYRDLSAQNPPGGVMRSAVLIKIRIN